MFSERLREDKTLGGRTSLSPERIADLLEMCLRSTYFSFGGNFYEQKEGVVMGSQVSAVVANLYMEFFEELALEMAPTRPRLWKKNVDDTFCILRKGSTKKLLCHLNRVWPTIKFTVEQEEDGALLQHTTQEKRGWQPRCLCLQEAHIYEPVSPLRVPSSDPHEERNGEMSP